MLPTVAELVIGHRQRGIHAVYDLHRFDQEKRDALLRWERRLLGIVEPPPPANVDFSIVNNTDGPLKTVRERLMAMLASFFGGIALLLAGVGLYGVLDYSCLQK